ncbi:MAG: hypothetical protein E6R04_06965 [Spirochaetes bacterium]|nr:MAG: hypothetical protein E6R04_06965 [Spirochaetota bacterium]
MRKTEFCNHYQAMSDHDECKIGVPYEKFIGLSYDQRPCFLRGCGPAPGGCEHQIFPTPDEIAIREAEMNKRYERMGKARKSIEFHLGGPWKRGTPGASGSIPCPNCDGTLRFSRAGYNGHIHAGCTTPNCCAWME